MNESYELRKARLILAHAEKKFQRELNLQKRYPGASCEAVIEDLELARDLAALEMERLSQ